jgi:hypothetical protein
LLAPEGSKKLTTLASNSLASMFEISDKIGAAAIPSVQAVVKALLNPRLNGNIFMVAGHRVAKAMTYIIKSSPHGDEVVNPLAPDDRRVTRQHDGHTCGDKQGLL